MPALAAVSPKRASGPVWVVEMSTAALSDKSGGRLNYLGKEPPQDPGSTVRIRRRRTTSWSLL